VGCEKIEKKTGGSTPPPKNVERVILQYVDRFLAEFFLQLTYTTTALLTIETGAN
jgi:hypothetical protein